MTRKITSVAGAMVAAVIMGLISLGVDVAVAPQALANPVYQVIDSDNDPYSGIYLRGGTSMANVSRVSANYVVYNTSAELLCGAWGEAVGPYSNRRWHQIRLTNGSNAGRVGWMPDRYMNTPNAANQPTPGEPECGGGGSVPTGSSSTPIWVGAPFAGYWAGPPNATSSRPESHNPVFTVPGFNYLSDLAFDFYQVAGTPVRVYAAPKDAALNSVVTAQVIGVGPTCGSGVIANGGYNVTVAFFDRGVRVGSVSYGHVQPDFNSDGATNATDINFRGAINRWGGYVGKVGAYTRNSCWDVATSVGQHTHIEFANVTNFACARGGLPNHASLAEHEYIGYLGGNFASRSKALCPNGI